MRPILFYRHRPDPAHNRRAVKKEVFFVKQSAKRALSGLLTLVMVLSLLTTGVSAKSAGTAEGDVTSQSSVYINPLYGDTITEDQLTAPKNSGLSTASTTAVYYYATLESAGSAMRRQLKNRAETIEINFQTADSECSDYMKAIPTEALRHTGVPTEGDYLLYQFAGYHCESTCRYYSGVHHLTLTYTVTYYTTAQQEQQVDAAISEILTSLDLDEKPDYEKVKAIYAYVCSHVSYDYTNLNDDSYLLKYTAYAALFNQTAVCQGFAVLLYRLLEEAGIDGRVIAGTTNSGSHAWNIAKLDDYYYNLDSTWDTGWTASHWCYFLKCDENFAGHYSNAEFLTDDFTASYPKADSDYVPHIWDSGAVTTAATCSKTGVKTYTCTQCGKTWTVTIPTISHTVVTDPAVAPTCTREGKTAGSHCSVCGTVIQAQDTVAKIDHTWDNGRVTADATCYDTGVKTYTCTQCKTTKTESIPTIAHTVVTDPAVAPTCTKEGKTAGSHCSVCGAVIQAQETVAKIDHTWDNGQVTAAATCYDTGVKTYTCTMCKTTKTESIPTISHTVVTDPAVAPTCTKEGKTAGSHCSVCGAVVQSQETVAKIDHTWDNGRVTADATTTAAGVTTYTCTACGTTRTEEIPKLTVSFADVPEGQYFTQPVAWAVSNGITNGTGANTFSPQLTCSRGQIVTFLWRAAGKPIVDMANPFTDVKEGAYYYNAVLWAYTSGITTGTDATTFSPDANCTRGQIVTFLWRYAGSPTVSAGSTFQDVAQGQYYTSAVYWAVAGGITNGTSQTTFSPNTVCTRSQAVTFLYRYAG
jgi:hypothetical protein